MRFRELAVRGAWVIDPERHEDARGFFARIWGAEEFAAHGLETAMAHVSVSYNRERGTLRGLHFQRAPHEETKLVRCTMGAAYDVVVDIRPDSPTYLGWAAVEITAENRQAVYIPAGCAHGFQTLAPGTEIAYQISAPWAPAASGGARWNDPRFGITWPLPVSVIAERDAAYPDWT